jgi:iron(II)-dependent oxidoreductase
LFSFLLIPPPAASPMPASIDSLAEATGIVEPELILIPGGEFVMGSDAETDHKPAHTVLVDSFYMDKYEVTNAQYERFCTETGRKLPEFWGVKELRCGPDFPNHPVNYVTWRDAKEYAEWRGLRLPTEAEWEYAARGGKADQRYPNGDELTEEDANYGNMHGGTLPVVRYPPNGYGLFDMAGNIGEWVADWYDPDYYGNSPGDNPTGPEDGKYKVVRGGGWHSGSYCNRVYRRLGLLRYWVDVNVGFRCAGDVKQ